MTEPTHVWYWRAWPKSSWGSRDERKGQACRVLAVGRRNSALVEMADGTRYITSRYAVRRTR